MNERQDFLDRALAEIADAVVCVIGLTNLHVRVAALPRSLAQAAGGQLAALEKMLVRVMMVLALGLVPGLLAARARGSAVFSGFQPFVSASSALLRAEQPVCGPYQRRLRLAPRAMNTSATSGFPGLPPARGPVAPARLIARIRAIQHVLSAPEAHARRLAFHLARLQTRGEPAPVVVPAPVPRKGTPALKLAAGILPVMLARDLVAWADTS